MVKFVRRDQNYRGAVRNRMLDMYPDFERIWSLPGQRGDIRLVQYPTTGVVRSSGIEVPGKIWEVYYRGMPVGEFMTRRKAKKAMRRMSAAA